MKRHWSRMYGKALALNLVAISEPLAGSNPCGINIRNDANFREVYYKLKDARNLARSGERNVVPGEPLSLSSQWHDVGTYSLEILTSGSKDLEVIAWLAEAKIRLDGFSGLRDVFQYSLPLINDYWDDIYSVGTEDIEDKVAPLAGLNGVSGEGTLIQAIRLAPLIPDAGFAQHTLWDYQLAQRPGETDRRERLHDAATDAGLVAMTAHLETVNECIEAFDAFVAALRDRCGDDAPPSSNTRGVLQEAASAIRVLAGIGDEEAIAGQTPQNGQDDAVDAISPAQTQSGGPQAIRSREEAFELLLSVARYFRRTEPHSPISLSIETMVRRGRMNFSELLVELLPEEQVRKAVLTAAGIQPKS